MYVNVVPSSKTNKQKKTKKKTINYSALYFTVNTGKQTPKLTIELPSNLYRTYKRN